MVARWKLVGRAQLACVWKLRRETQEEHWRNLILRRSNDDYDGASCHTISTKTVQSSSSSYRTTWTGRSSTGNQQFATARVRNDTPSLSDVNGLGRPKEVSGKEEDSQQWSKKTEAFFAGVIKESEMMLEWASEQTMEISTEFIDREYLLIATNQERGAEDLEFILQQMYTVLSDITIAPWRHGGGWRSYMIQQQEEGRETFFVRSFLRDFALSWNFKRELNAGSPMCRAARRSLRIRWMTRSSWLARRRWFQKSLRNT